MKLNRTGSIWNRAERNKVNDNWDKLEGSIIRIDDTVSDLVLESGGDSNLEVVQARGGKSVLNERLNEIESNSFTNYTELRDSIGSKVEKDVFWNEINNKRDSSVPISINDISNDLVAAIKGSTEFNLLSIPRDKSVTESKTTFINMSKNLFDKNSTIKGKGLNLDNGNLRDDENQWYTDYFSVDPSSEITKNAGIICFYNQSKSFIEGYLYPNNSPIDVPNSAVYARISVANSLKDSLMVNYGSTLLPYESFYKELDTSLIKKDSISEEMLKDRSVTSDKRTPLGNMGLLTFTNPVELPNLKNNKVTIKKPLRVTVNKKRYDIDDAGYIDIVFSQNGIFQYLYFNVISKNFRFLSATEFGKVTENEVLIAVMQFSGDPSHESLIGIFSTCEFNVNGQSYYDFMTKNKGHVESNLYINNNIPKGVYVSDILPAANGSSGSIFNDAEFIAQDVYDKLDVLMSNNQSYISKKKLGEDESGNLPIYLYKFIPEKSTYTGSAVVKKRPKIVIVAGEHGDGDGGDPNTSIYALYNLLESVVNKWDSDDFLYYLRWHVELIVIPVANPYGINNKQKYNFNNVDINRNWDYNWNQYVGNEKGPEPFSEKETRYIKGVIEENKEEVLAYVNLHTIGGVDFVYEDKLLRYINNVSDTGYQIANDVIIDVSNMWKKERTVDDGIKLNGLIEETTNRPRSASWVESELGIFGLTLECFVATKSIRDRNTSEIITMNTEHIGNFLISTLRYFNK